MRTPKQGGTTCVGVRGITGEDLYSKVIVKTPKRINEVTIVGDSVITFSRIHKIDCIYFANKYKQTSLYYLYIISHTRPSTHYHILLYYTIQQ